MNGDDAWRQLSAEQQKAAIEAARLIQAADMQFMMLLFGEGKTGAIVANIEPPNAINLIEEALMAAKATAGNVTEFNPEERLH